MSQLILNKNYDFDSLADMEEDIADAISDADIPVDGNGVFSGHLSVQVVYNFWEEDEEDLDEF